MKMTKTLLLFILIMNFNSCTNDIREDFVQIWKVENIVDRSINEDVRRCFKSEFIFVGDNNLITVPGFIKPYDSGKYIISEDNRIVLFSNFEECFFESSFELSIDYKDKRPYTMLLKNDSLEVFCKVENFENDKMDVSFTRSVLDSSSWNTSQCNLFRRGFCR